MHPQILIRAPLPPSNFEDLPPYGGQLPYALNTCGKPCGAC